MQTPSISPAANLIPAQAPSNGAAAADNGAPAFNQVLSQEVSQRKNAEAPRSQDGKQEKHNTSETRASGDNAKPGTDAKQADEASAADGSTAASAEPGQDAAAQVSAELLALVANVAQLQNGEAGAKEAAAETEESQVELDLPAGRKRNSPFAAIHSAVGARANHGTQTKPDGTWAAQVERGTTGRIDAGKPDVALPLQAATAAQVATAKAAANAGEFAGALKDASQLVQPFQQAVTQAAQALAPQAADRLSPRLGTPGWDQALGQKIVWMVNGEQQSASLTLNPPELGPLKVVLQVSNAQANATFVAAQPEVRQALEAAMPKLRDMLGEAGIQLGQATVDSGSQQQQAAERQMGRASGVAGGADAAESAAQTTSIGVRPSAAGQGLVDTFA